MAGVVLTEPLAGLADSKALDEKRREALAPLLRTMPHHLVILEVAEIDTLGLSALLRRGLEEIRRTLKAESYLFDGPHAYGVAGIRTLIKADATVQAVMGASILAKTARDAIMVEMERLYPGYGFAAHKGYGTKAHYAALDTLGVSPIHRRSFLKKFQEKRGKRSLFEECIILQ